VHQQFATTGIAPARTIGVALFGAGTAIGLALGHGATASIATEVDTFVMRRDQGMTSAWSPLLGVTVMAGVGWSP